MKIIDVEQESEDRSSRGEILKVLVVDDSPVYHKLVSDALCYQPYFLIHATNGSEALDGARCSALAGCVRSSAEVFASF